MWRTAALQSGWSRIKKGEYRPLKIHEVKQLYALAKTKVKEETDVKKQIKRGSTDYLGNTRKKTE